jgi:UMF1 family MFS transporter
MSHEIPVSPVDPSGSQVANVTRGQVWSWALWDWASSGFAAVVTTFVFAVYLTSSSFGNEDDLAGQVAFAAAIGGFIVAIFAPVIGRRSDDTGRRKRGLFIATMTLVIITATLFFIEPAPQFFIAGLALFTLAGVVFEFAQVNYNAMLSQVSTPSTIGRVSGFGWGLGYVGGIALLLILLIGFIQPDVGWFGVDSTNSLNIRATMLVTALWLGVFSIPLFLRVPETKPLSTDRGGSFWQGYRELGVTIRELAKHNRPVLWFLLASAIYRDGLNGAFTLGGIIAARAFGLDFTSILFFAIAGNLVAGVVTLVAGRLDDAFGPKPVILVSLTVAMLAGLGMFVLYDFGTPIFWATGLTLAACIGPIQAASRGLLLRLAPQDSPGALFGLYATTGRITSFLSQLLFGICVAAFGSTIFGVLGIAVVLLAGLLLLLPVKIAHRSRQAVTIGSAAQ